MEGPRREDAARIGELTGRRPIGFRRAAGGYTAAERWVVDFECGAGAFAKIGIDRLGFSGVRIQAVDFLVAGSGAARSAGFFSPAFFGGAAFPALDFSTFGFLETGFTSFCF